jgi:hypothetical protein
VSFIPGPISSKISAKGAPSSAVWTRWRCLLAEDDTVELFNPSALLPLCAATEKVLEASIAVIMFCRFSCEYAVDSFIDPGVVPSHTNTLTLQLLLWDRNGVGSPCVD